SIAKELGRQVLLTRIVDDVPQVNISVRLELLLSSTVKVFNLAPVWRSVLSSFIAVCDMALPAHFDSPDRETCFSVLYVLEIQRGSPSQRRRKQTDTQGSIQPLLVA